MHHWGNVHCTCAVNRERTVGLCVCEEPRTAAAFTVDPAVWQQTWPEGQGPGAEETHSESTLNTRVLTLTARYVQLLSANCSKNATTAFNFCRPCHPYLHFSVKALFAEAVLFQNQYLQTQLLHLAFMFPVALEVFTWPKLPWLWDVSKTIMGLILLGYVWFVSFI